MLTSHIKIGLFIVLSYCNNYGMPHQALLEDASSSFVGRLLKYLVTSKEERVETVPLLFLLQFKGMCS